MKLKSPKSNIYSKWDSSKEWNSVINNRNEAVAYILNNNKNLQSQRVED